MGDTGRQIGSIILLSIAGLFGAGLLRIIISKIMENIKRQKKGINGFINKFGLMIKKIWLKNTFNKTVLIFCIILLGGIIISMFNSSLGVNIILIGLFSTPIIFPILYIIPQIKGIDGGFITSLFKIILILCIVVGIILLLDLADKNKDNLLLYGIVGLSLLKRPLIIASGLGVLYALVRFIKRAWKN